MVILGIDQENAARAMTILGVCELVSRFLMSYFGDRFKGRFIQIYVICTTCLCIQNILGYFATNYRHMIAFASGSYYIVDLIKITRTCSAHYLYLLTNMKTPRTAKQCPHLEQSHYNLLY